MNGISTLWQGIVDDLNDNKEDLGITEAGRASTGKVTHLAPPSAAVWLIPASPFIVSQHGPLKLALDVFIFCIAAPTDTEASGVDAAIDLAAKILAHLTDAEIEGTVLEQPDNEPALEIVEKSSTGSVVGVQLKAEVEL